ncbi:MAG TPA: YpdA family putative bacillithiol disulfide reductase [Gemmatimonadales bacterium]|nr:YpdA family putative bacillithiol disulfide reductase [Gemmatimonadales bacterium]
MATHADVDTLIAGAGPIGLACAISARRRGISPLVVDQGAITNSIARYPVGMTFFTTPERLEIGGHPLVCAGGKASREEALMYYRGVVRAEGLRVRTYTRIVGAERSDAGFRCELVDGTSARELRCRRLVLATGYFDHANLLGVPGESLPHVSHWFDEAHYSAGRDVVIIGGKNSAVEAALQCFRVGARVTLIYRRPAFKPSVKYWLKPDLDNRIAAGEIAAYLNAVVTSITPTSVQMIDADGTERAIAADRVYALTGYHPDFALLESLGVAVDPVTGRPALDPGTLETNVPGLHLAGSVGAGRHTSEVFIENGRFDGEKIFGDATSRAAADSRYAQSPRPIGE